jgi:hypothetical protein
MRIIYDQASNCVKWAPVTVHDYLIDPKYPNYQDARYVIFYRYIDEMEAIDLLGLDPDSDETEAQIAQLMCTYRNQAGEQLRGIRLTEFWHRGATLKYPKGFYASFIGDAVAQFFPEYPYQLRYKSGDYNPLPVVVFKAISQIDSAYGVTQLSDATKLQRQLNETVSRIMQISRQTSTAHLILPKNIADQWVADTDETHIIGVSTNELQYATNIRYTELPNVPSALLDQRIYFEQKLYDVLGINEATAGTDQRLRSGRALDRIQTLDKMKNAGAAKNLSRAITDAWRLTLALIQHYYSEAKTITLANTNMPRTLAFTGADLLGADIRLEESSSIDQLEISKQLAAREDLAAGFISKPEFEALTYSDNAAAVNDLIAQYLEGYRVEINTDLLDPNHVASAVKRLQNEAIASGSKDLWVKLEQLRQKLSASVAASEAATADVATEQG